MLGLAAAGDDAGTNSPPGPNRSFPFAPMFHWARFLRDPIRFMTEARSRYGDIVDLSGLGARRVIVFKDEYLEQILNDPARFRNIDVSSCPLRLPAETPLRNLFSGLTFMNGEEHRAHRRVIAPVFDSHRTAQFSSHTSDVTRGAMADLAGRQTVDIYLWARRVTFEIATRLVLGSAMALDSRHLQRLMDAWLGAVFSLSSVVFPFDVPGTQYHRLLRLSAALEREIVAAFGAPRDGADDAGGFLDLIENPKGGATRPLSRNAAVGHVNLLLLAGHMTTACALCWTLFLLAQHPRVYAAVLGEIDSLDADRTSQVGQLNSLKLLHNVILESLRLCPPILWWSRTCTAATRLGSYDIEAGTQIIFSAFMTHRDPHVFKHPNRFLPDRWDTEHPTPFQFIAFSAGPRKCIGSNLALLELKVMLVELLRDHWFSLPPDAKIDYSGFMLCAPKGGMALIPNPRSTPLYRNTVTGSVNRLVELDGAA